MRNHKNTYQKQQKVKQQLYFQDKSAIKSNKNEHICTKNEKCIKNNLKLCETTTTRAESNNKWDKTVSRQNSNEKQQKWTNRTTLGSLPGPGCLWGSHGARGTSISPQGFRMIRWHVQGAPIMLKARWDVQKPQDPQERPDLSQPPREAPWTLWVALGHSGFGPWGLWMPLGSW